MIDITGLLGGTDLKRYTLSVTMDEHWVAYKDPAHCFNEASLRENRFNREGQAAFYVASGDNTARHNVPDWSEKVKCTVSPQTITCFNLPEFATSHGIGAEFVKSKSDGGYPLPQATADLLSEKGITGILYSNAGGPGLCVAIRPTDSRMIGDMFFVIDQRTGNVSSES